MYGETMMMMMWSRYSRRWIRRRSSTSERSVEECKTLLVRLHEQILTKTNEAMSNKIVGHDQLKRALTLGIVSGEHVYVEGT